LHVVGILFPHIKDDARSKSHQMDLKLQHNLLDVETTVYLK